MPALKKGALVAPGMHCGTDIADMRRAEKLRNYLYMSSVEGRTAATSMNATRNAWILGINSAYHEPAACLLHNGKIVAAAEEERFNRIRHGKRADLLNPHELPVRSIQYCMDEAGIEAKDLFLVGYSFEPDDRLAFNAGLDRETEPGCAGTAEGEARFHELLLRVPSELSGLLGQDLGDRFLWLPHHLTHAASAFFVSPFERAAILSTDGIGEATSTWLGVGEGSSIRAIKEIKYPHSLGFLWTKASRFLGFGEYGQWKVMALAGFGDPQRFADTFRGFVSFDDDGNFRIDSDVMQFRRDSCDGFERLFGSKRAPGGAIVKHHHDFAAALQALTNDAMLAFGRFLHRETGAKALCQAGGVALNCIANERLLEEGPFDEVFVQPAANDAGTALGACFYIWNQILNGNRVEVQQHAYLGPSYEEAAVPTEDDAGSETLRQAARLIARGEVVAWFQGRMEWGPRALGNRSILADPRRPETKQKINDAIKHREYFRPFAASVLTERASDWFDIRREAFSDRFMLYARKVRSDKLGRIPAVTHIDNTCRIQRVDAETNPRYHQLIREFEALTGVPMVLNTSLNDREPLICSPEDAFKTCRKAGIRYLVLGDRIVDFAEGTKMQSEPVLVGVDRNGSDVLCATGAESASLAFRSR